MAVGEDAQLGARAGALARVAEQRAARPADGGQSRAEGDGGGEHRGRPLAHLGGALGRLDEARRARAAREAQKLRLEPDLHRTKLRRPPADGVEAQPLERLEVLGAIEQVGANLVVEAQRGADLGEEALGRSRRLRQPHVCPRAARRDSDRNRKRHFFSRERDLRNNKSCDLVL